MQQVAVMTTMQRSHRNHDDGFDIGNNGFTMMISRFLELLGQAEVHAAALAEASKAGREPSADDVEETSMFGWGSGLS